MQAVLRIKNRNVLLEGLLRVYAVTRIPHVCIPDDCSDMLAKLRMCRDGVYAVETGITGMEAKLTGAPWGTNISELLVDEAVIWNVGDGQVPAHLVMQLGW